MPSATTDMASPGNDASLSGGAATALGIACFGRGAPVASTLLFTLYYFHSPWLHPSIFHGSICVHA